MYTFTFLQLHISIITILKLHRLSLLERDSRYGNFEKIKKNFTTCNFAYNLREKMSKLI